MKKFLLFSFFIFSFSLSKAQWVTIPDANFVAWLQIHYPTCMNGNLMDTTCNGIVNSTWVDCSNKNISNLDGIQYFDNLMSLDCHTNGLTNLPNLTDSLFVLDCSYNQIVSLPILPISLGWLECSYNQLTNLPSLDSVLISLSCHDNQLISLPILNTKLKYLNCNYNQLSIIPTIPPKLINLSCQGNQITSLPFFSDSLKVLDCSYNQLNLLPSLPNGLHDLNCGHNLLTFLPTLPDSLFGFVCSYNQLTSLPLLPPYIYGINCDHNQLTSLPDLPDSLASFKINNNPLQCIPAFYYFSGPSSYFNISGTGISCLQNLISHTGYIAGIDTMAICDLFNNPNNCDLNWNINGNVGLDVDSSCITTNDGVGIAMMKLNLFDSGNNLLQQVIANWGGDYSFDTQLGDYNTSVDTVNIPFNVLCPINNNIASNLTPVDSMDYNVDFRLVCKPGFDNGAWNIYRNAPNFFSGNTTPIHIVSGDFTQSIYNINCSSGINGEVKVVINGPANYVSPLAGALTPTVIGDTLIYLIADFSLVNATTDFAFNIITDASAQIGNQICFDVTVTPTVGDNNISNNTLTHCFAVSNSFDPNEKEVSPVGSLAYPYNDWITYTIHFQNTGTAAAQHIQILDTLDADLDASTFQLLSYSFAPMVQLFGSDVKFNFVNINLPDSGSNLAGSQGYVSYRVMPIANLPLGTSIKNTASIYFDFNSPVVTNTVSNLICNPTTSTTTATICEGDFYFFEGSSLTVSGNYSVTLQSVDGCDSILNLNLIVDPTITNSIGASICSGVTLDFNGQQLSTTGIYHDTLTASTGCDSIVHLTLTVLPPVTANINQTICEGDSINFNGTMLDTTGIYADTLSTISGCDSIVTLHLSLINTVTH
ncbi:MAG: hypothetical protein WCI97_08970, partial [Bacteroidota bacterium]